jgi:hypothetical protein
MKAISRWIKRKDFLVLSLFIFVHPANLAQSVFKDLESGLTSMGKGLSCNQVYLSDGQQVTKRNVFIYGETYYVNYDGMHGFVREAGNAFPDMQILIVGEHGDTVLYINDLYAGYTDGIGNDPLDLYAEITVAEPMHSGGDYTLHVDISDKRGDGSFRTSLDFSVLRDQRIEVESEQLTGREIYLFSQQTGQTITDGRTGFNETIYLLFEGLEGFVVQDGQVQLGMSMLVRDAEGNTILDQADLFGDAYQSHEDVHQQVASSLVLTGNQIANPVQFRVRIWDKNGPGWIRVVTELIVE